MNRNIIIIAIIAIVAVIGVGYYSLSTVTGYITEIYGEINLEDDWSILSSSNTKPKQDYSLFNPSTNDGGISILNTDEVIIVVEINDKTFEQNLGNYQNLTSPVDYNVVITHLQKGEYNYRIFLYKTTGIVMKSRILQDQMESTLTI